MDNQLLRKLPKIDEILKEDIVQQKIQSTIRNLAVDILREVIDDYRKRILNNKIIDFSKEDIINSFINIMESKQNSNLRKVINGTGIIIHTNLGRAILSKSAIDNVLDVTENYSNLEYDIDKGKRGLRYTHIEEILTKITGAEGAMVVNNNAAAVMLVLNTICRGKEAIVSRGQLVEIGGSFRIPDVMNFSGVKLIEVGTTNKTHVYDYENKINNLTGALLKVHTSNFRVVGFTEEVSLGQLVYLGKKYNIPVIEDIGSGVLIDFSKYGFTYEPTVNESIKQGIDIVTFSGDKMLGGPQCGIIVGKEQYIEKIKENQLTRALRVDKMTLAALEGTLKYYLDEKEAIKNIPTLYMMLSSEQEHKRRAERLKVELENNVGNFQFKVEKDYSMVGGGSMPTEKIPTYVIKVASNKFEAKDIETKLRKNEIPIIVRISNGEVVIDLRTVKDIDFQYICEAFINIEEGEIDK